MDRRNFLVSARKSRPFALTMITAGLGLMAAPLVGATSGTSAAPAASPSSYKTTVIREEWGDAKRGRFIPVKIYLPEGPGPFPVVIHSHGLGGSREASTMILEQIAAAGFVVVALQHPGSDSALVVAGGRAAVAAGRNPMDASASPLRFGDVPFALDELARRNAGVGALAGKLDLKHIGMSGHSFGALGTLVAVGQRLPGPGGDKFSDARITAAVVYSPNKPRNGDPTTALGGIATPILHFTGTQDRTPLDLEKTPWERTIPYQTITRADQYLVVIKGGDHALYSGRRIAQGTPNPDDAADLRVVTDETIRFWRAYLKGNVQALSELCGLRARVASVGDGYVKAGRCGPPTPITPAR